MPQMLRVEDYYDILAANERFIEDARHSQRRALESPKNAQLQERYLQQANSLGLIPARFCSPARRTPASPRPCAAKPATSLSQTSGSPTLLDAHTSVRLYHISPHDYAYGPFRPSRDQVAREIARADASTPSNSAAAALTATSALSKRHRTPCIRTASSTPWRRTVSCPGSDDGSTRSSWDTRSTDSDSSSYTVASKQSVCNSTSTATASEISFSMSPCRRGVLDKSYRDMGSGQSPLGNSSVSDVSSLRPRQSRQLDDATAKLEAATRLLELMAEGPGSKWRENVFGDGFRVGYMARSSSDGGCWSQKTGGGSGQSTGLLMEPSPAFLRRWRTAKKKQHAKKQAVRFLLRTLDEGDLGGEDGRGAIPPVAPNPAAAAAPARSHRASSSGGCSSGGGQQPWGPGVVIVYPGSTVAFPAQPLPYSLSEALEAASRQVQLHATQPQQQPASVQHAVSPWEPRHQLPPAYQQKQDLREGAVWGAPPNGSLRETPHFGAPPNPRHSSNYLASSAERATLSVPHSTALRSVHSESAADVGPIPLVQPGIYAPMPAPSSQQQRPLPEYGNQQRQQVWYDTPSGQPYGVYDAGLEREAMPAPRYDGFNGRQEMSAAQRASNARMSSAVQFFSGGGARCDSSSSRDGWAWVHGRGSAGAGFSVSAGGASSSHADDFVGVNPAAFERLTIPSPRNDAPLLNATPSLHSDVSAVTPAPAMLPIARNMPHNQTSFGLIPSQRGVVAEQSRMGDSLRSGSGGGSGGGSGSGGGGMKMNFIALGSSARSVPDAWANNPSPVPQAYPAHYSQHYNSVAEWAAAATQGIGVGGDAHYDAPEGLLAPGSTSLHARFGTETPVDKETATIAQGPGVGSTGCMGEDCSDAPSPITAQTMLLLRDQQDVISRDVHTLLRRVADIRGRLRA